MVTHSEATKVGILDGEKQYLVRWQGQGMRGLRVRTTLRREQQRVMMVVLVSFEVLDED